MHSRVARTEREIAINLLETGKRMVYDGYGSFNHGTVFKALDVSGVDNIDALTCLWTRPVAEDALSVD
jgi:hypothetical protein